MIEDEKEAMPGFDAFATWQNIKRKYREAIVLVRHENEYLTFNSDAVAVSSVMGIELKGETGDKQMCCLPHYLTDIILHKMVKAGSRIALCEPLFFSPAQ